MAYTAATAAILKAAFPRFAAVADDTVTYWIVRAQRSVDASWTEDDRQMGEMLLAAHSMTLNGLGTGTEAEMASAGISDFKSVRSASFSFTRGDGDPAASSGELGSTSYGRQFSALARVNVGGPRVMATGTLATSWPESA